MGRRWTIGSGEKDAEGDGPPVRTRGQAGRGWGPFSGRQLTTIIVTVLVLVGFPFAAFAVTGSNVFVTDAKSGKRANVSAAGRLSTTANVAYPTSAMVWPISQSVNDCTTTTVCTAKVAPPAGKALVITAIHLDVAIIPNPPTEADSIELAESGDGTCENFSLDHDFDVVDPATRGIVNLEYPPPGGIVIPAGHAFCARAGDRAGMLARVSITAYVVAGSALPAATPSTHR